MRQIATISVTNLLLRNFTSRRMRPADSLTYAKIGAAADIVAQSSSLTDVRNAHTMRVYTDRIALASDQCR